MSLFRSFWRVFDRGLPARSRAGRATLSRAPACELLEGRQLLNAAWGPPQGIAKWDGPWTAGPPLAGHIQSLGLSMPGGPRGAHDLWLGGHPGLAGHGHGPGALHFPAPSPQLQADFQTLQADEKALEAELPASVTAAVKADKATIEKAFAALTPAQMRTLHHAGPHHKAPGTDPLAHLASELTAAGISPAQASSITTDLQNLKTALTATDPALQLKIAADRLAIAKDGGPSFPVKGPGPGMHGSY